MVSLWTHKRSNINKKQKIFSQNDEDVIQNGRIFGILYPFLHSTGLAIRTNLQAGNYLEKTCTLIVYNNNKLLCTVQCPSLHTIVDEQCFQALTKHCILRMYRLVNHLYSIQYNTTLGICKLGNTSLHSVTVHNTTKKLMFMVDVNNFDLIQEYNSEQKLQNSFK